MICRTFFTSECFPRVYCVVVKVLLYLDFVLLCCGYIYDCVCVCVESCWFFRKPLLSVIILTMILCCKIKKMILCCFAGFDNWCWAMWYEDGHRDGATGRQVCHRRETGPILQEQCYSSMAVPHLRPKGTRWKEVFWKVLCWSNRSYQ